MSYHVPVRAAYRGIDPIQERDFDPKTDCLWHYGGRVGLKPDADLAKIVEYHLSIKASPIYHSDEGRIYIKPPLNSKKIDVITTKGVKQETIEMLFQKIVKANYEKGEHLVNELDEPPVPGIEKKLTQQSAEWTAWRQKGIGASDSAIIMNYIPFNNTAYQLWEKKTGRRPNDEMNPAMLRGQELEDPAREDFIKKTGITVFPRCVVHPEHNFIRASLDGISIDGIIVEIKCGKYSYNEARRGKVSIGYLCQMQHQLACTPEARYVLNWNWDPVNGGILIKVERDPVFIAQLLKAECAFWDAVQKKVPPPLPMPIEPKVRVEDKEPPEVGTKRSHRLITDDDE